MTPDPWLAPLLLLAVVAAFCGVLAIGAGLVWLSDKVPQWRRQRRRVKRAKSLPAPDDPRLRNVISLTDYRNRTTAAKRLRSVA